MHSVSAIFPAPAAAACRGQYPSLPEFVLWTTNSIAEKAKDRVLDPVGVVEVECISHLLELQVVAMLLRHFTLHEGAGTVHRTSRDE